MDTAGQKRRLQPARHGAAAGGCNLHARQGGAQAVEFALMLPFVALVLFAVLDFGIIVYNKAIITNASREAVRRGIILSAATWNPASVKQVACDYARSALVTVGSGTRTTTCTGTADPVVTMTPTTAPAFNDPIAVTVSYTVRGFSMGSWYGLGTGANTVGSALTLVSSTRMNHE